MYQGCLSPGVPLQSAHCTRDRCSCDRLPGGLLGAGHGRAWPGTARHGWGRRAVAISWVARARPCSGLAFIAALLAAASLFTFSRRASRTLRALRQPDAKNSVLENRETEGWRAHAWDSAEPAGPDGPPPVAREVAGGPTQRDATRFPMFSTKCRADRLSGHVGHLLHALASEQETSDKDNSKSLPQKY